MTQFGNVSINLIARPNADSEWLPRNTLGAGANINQSWLSNEMVLQYPGSPNTISCLTDYQQSVSKGLFRVSLDDLNGYGIGPRDLFAVPPAPETRPKRTYAKWYLQPGMKVDCPAFIDDTFTLVIDQIFPEGTFPDSADNPNQFLNHKRHDYRVIFVDKRTH